MIEKILERLEERRLEYEKVSENLSFEFPQRMYYKGVMRGYEYSKDVVQEVAKEYGKDTNVRSNADKIRAMSDEELAKFLGEYEVCTNCTYLDKKRCTFENPCVKEFATAMAYEWLKSEAKE